MVEAPTAEIVFEIDQLFSELVKSPVFVDVLVNDLPFRPDLRTTADQLQIRRNHSNLQAILLLTTPGSPDRNRNQTKYPYFSFVLFRADLSRC